MCFIRVCCNSESLPGLRPGPGARPYHAARPGGLANSLNDLAHLSGQRRASILLNGRLDQVGIIRVISRDNWLGQAVQVKMEGFVLLASGSGLLAIGAVLHTISQRKETQAKMIQETPARKVRSYQCRVLDKGKPSVVCGLTKWTRLTSARNTNSELSLVITIIHTVHRV